MASKLSLFLAELKRRRVIRVALAYLIVGVGVVEGADIIGTPLGLPEWILPAFSLLVVVGFPIALVIAWALEVTPDGIQRTPDLTPDQLASQTPAKWSPSSWILGGIGLVVVVAAGYFVLPRGGAVSAPQENDGAEFESDHKVAVFPFQNLTGDSAREGLSLIAQHQVTAGLTWAEELLIIPAAYVHQVREAEPEDVTDREVAASLGAGIMVTGIFTSMLDGVVFQAQVTMLHTEEALPVIEVSGSAAEPMVVVEDLQQRVMGQLAGYLDEAWSSRSLVLAAPSYAALRAYLRGRNLLSSQDMVGSLRHFHEAHALDQGFVEPLVIAATIYILLGRRPEADSLLATLESRRNEISPDERLWLDALDAWVRHRDWQGQLIPLRAIALRDPGALSFLANAALGSGRPEEAIEAAGKMDLRLSQGPRRWRFLVSARYALGQYDEVLLATREARVLFSDDLDLRFHEVRALIAKGLLDEAIPLWNEIEDLEPIAGYWPPTPGHVLVMLARDLVFFGHQEEARGLTLTAIEWWRARDPEEHKLLIAQALLFMDRTSEALELLRPLAEKYPEDLFVRGTLGVALAKSGDQTGALGEATWLAGLDRPYLLGDDTAWRAKILSHLDRRDEAVRLLGQAFEEGIHQAAYLRHPLLKPLWGYEPYEQLIAPKG